MNDIQRLIDADKAADDRRVLTVHVIGTEPRLVGELYDGDVLLSVERGFTRDDLLARLKRLGRAWLDGIGWTDKARLEIKEGAKAA